LTASGKRKLSRIIHFLSPQSKITQTASDIFIIVQCSPADQTEKGLKFAQGLDRYHC
jgi:hypothetical protein